MAIATPPRPAWSQVAAMSRAVEALARCGAAELLLIDLDQVSESNINRQIQALGSTVGMAKAEALRLTNMRASQAAKAGNPGPEGSVGKSMMATLNQAIFEKAVDLQGMEGQIEFDYTFRRPEDLSVDGAASGVGHGFLRVRANSIEGGTSEIMRNILGEQVLGLPGEPRIDKDIPWIDVPRS